jgi:hypothetical protein
MDAQIQNQSNAPEQAPDVKDRKAASAILTRAIDRQKADQANEQSALEGARQLAYGLNLFSSASLTEDPQERVSKATEARNLIDDAYKKLATVDKSRAEILVSAEQAKINEAKFSEAAQKHNTSNDKGMVAADVANFKEIENPFYQEVAAVQMADNMRNNAGYKSELEASNPEVASKVAELDAANNMKYQAEAGQGKLDATEPSVQGRESMTLDPLAIQNVASIRERDSAEVREQLALNVLEKGRSAVASVQANSKGNSVESDEVFTAQEKDSKPIVPLEIENQYLRVGDKFYHPKNTDLIAFEDKGNKLETKSNSEAIAESMVRIAEARGWDEIKVSGSETFRKEIWLEAASRGMNVKGYSPSEQDKAELAKRTKALDTNKIETDKKYFRARENDDARNLDKSTTAPQSRESSSTRTAESSIDDKTIKGTLIAHGAAKYMHDPKNTDSYYVKTTDDKGIEKTSWGIDLERAVKESGAKPGDKIAITNEGRKPVTVTVPVRDDNGNVIDHQDKKTHRNQWNVQLAQAFAKESPTEAVKKHPELASAVAAVAAMDKKAEADGMTPEQRAIISARVRQNVVNSIERGDIPNVKIKEEIEVNRTAKREKELSR